MEMAWQFIADSKEELVEKLTSNSYNTLESGLLMNEQILEWHLLKRRFYFEDWGPYNRKYPYYVMWSVVSATELLADVKERDTVTNQVLSLRFKGGDTTTFIACFLLFERDGKWGYKRIKEEDNPSNWGCPLHLLDKAPVTCQRWRDLVYAYAEGDAKRAFPGKALVRLLLDITEQPFRSEELMSEMADHLVDYLIRIGVTSSGDYNVHGMFFDEGLLPEDDSTPFAWALESATGGLTTSNIAAEVEMLTWKRLEERLRKAAS